MKISKLFHWLYAIVMLLPAFAIGVTCAYAIFNKNAYQSNGNDYVDKTITLNNSNINDIYVDGQLVTYTFKEHSTQWNGVFGFSEISINLNEIFNTELTYNRFYLYSSNTNITFYDTNNGTHLLNSNDRTFDSFTYVVDLSISNDKSIYNYGLAQVFTYKERALTDIFYYSIDKVQHSPLFNWAYDSFLVTPITYITSLFGMPDNNIVILLMSYWLDISIIYLVFDLIMYVPLLVHRWLDKGVLE